MNTGGGERRDTPMSGCRADFGPARRRLAFHRDTIDRKVPPQIDLPLVPGQCR